MSLHDSPVYIALIAILAHGPVSLAQTPPPDSLSFQGFLTDAGGDALNDTVNITTKLYKGATSVYTQDHVGVVVSGGVFNRADGLWEEIQADLFAKTAGEAVDIARDVKPRPPENRVPGAPKKRRRRRRPPLLAQAEMASQPSA